MSRFARVVVLVAFASITIPGSAAEAACRVSGVCLWADKNFDNTGGCPICFSASYGDLTRRHNHYCRPPHAASSAHETWNDCASSIFSTLTCCKVTVYEHANFGGRSASFNDGPYGNGIPNLRSVRLNDAVSSFSIDCSAATRHRNCP